jgi:GNAT superfamily N-acetyltransferase
VGLHPEVAAEGLQPAFLAAVERRARREGAQHLVLALSLPLARSLDSMVAAAGYRLAKRRVTMEAPLVRRPASCPRPMRPVRPDDAGEAEALARVMLESYAGGIDYEGETLDETLDEVRRVMGDGWGPFLPDCSFVLLGDEGEPGGAALVTQEVADETWLCEVFVHPRYRGQGCARPLIQAAMNACLDRGYARMGLMVTLGNVPAEGLYRRLGFAEEEGSEEHHFEKELTGQ